MAWGREHGAWGRAVELFWQGEDNDTGFRLCASNGLADDRYKLPERLPRTTKSSSVELPSKITMGRNKF